MAFKRTYLTQKDINQFHPSCIQCTKGIKPEVNVILIRHRGLHESGVYEAYAHERCFMKFATEIADSPQGPAPTTAHGLKITKDQVAKSAAAVREVAMA